MTLYVAFILASVALIAVPGPNVAVIVANSVRHGVRYGLVTVAGTSSAMVLQLSITVAGLSGLLALVAHGFEALRWAGVAYLLYLGVMAWRAPATDLSAVHVQDVTARQMFWQGFAVSLTNPKTLLFYAAFLPQFVAADAEPTTALALLSATFVGIAVVLDGCWAFAAARLGYLVGVSVPIVNKVTGGILLTAAASLAIVRRPV